MNILIIKLGATGDVVRTTPLLRRLDGEVSWITASKNLPLLEGLPAHLRSASWEQRELFRDPDYDLVVNLEDTLDVAQFLHTIKYKRLFGAYADTEGALHYTDDSRGWFDLSLISRFGIAEADLLKLKNRQTYQELIFEGLGFSFGGEAYLMPEPVKTGLSEEAAIAAESRPD